jgi:hypothetical protein
VADGGDAAPDDVAAAVALAVGWEAAPASLRAALALLAAPTTAVLAHPLSMPVSLGFGVGADGLGLGGAGSSVGGGAGGGSRGGGGPEGNAAALAAASSAASSLVGDAAPGGGGQGAVDGGPLPSLGECLDGVDALAEASPFLRNPFRLCVTQAAPAVPAAALAAAAASLCRGPGAAAVAAAEAEAAAAPAHGAAALLTARERATPTAAVHTNPYLQPLTPRARASMQTPYRMTGTTCVSQIDWVPVTDSPR